MKNKKPVSNPSPRTIADDIFDLKPKKKAVNGKAKGNTAERLVAKLFTDWCGFEFNRVPSSGGLRWGNNQGIVGDITPGANAHFPFVVEVKSYNTVELDRFKEMRKNSKVYTFWKQAYRDGSRANKAPLLLIRCNGMAKEEFWCFMNAEVFSSLTKMGEDNRFLHSSTLIGKECKLRGVPISQLTAKYTWPEMRQAGDEIGFIANLI